MDISESEKASSCPFCGGRDLYISRKKPNGEGIPTSIACFHCGAIGPFIIMRPVDNDDVDYVAECTGWNDRFRGEREADA